MLGVFYTSGLPNPAAQTLTLTLLFQGSQGMLPALLVIPAGILDILSGQNHLQREELNKKKSWVFSQLFLSFEVNAEEHLLSPFPISQDLVPVSWGSEIKVGGIAESPAGT